MTVNVKLFDAIEYMLAGANKTAVQKAVHSVRADMPQGFNRDFAEHNKEFKDACERAKVKPTRRQASKYRRKFGSAYAHRKPTV